MRPEIITLLYAAYDKKSDHDIHDTIKRADQKMYECKAAMKGR